MKRYYVYIITNIQKNILYVGVTNNWQKRIDEHIADAGNKKTTYAGKYNCRYLLLLEEFMFVKDAITREKEIKGWRREKKDALITAANPEWHFLNES
jgi:putative endonuclease